VAAVVAIVSISPLALPYFDLQRQHGFTRPVEAAASFSATGPSYLASSSYAHAWMLSFITWSEPLFPGFVITVFGIAGACLAFRQAGARVWREMGLMYGGIAALAFWESLGPRAGLYRVTYAMVPGFTFLRAPSRFGILVVFGLSVLAAFGVSRFLAWMDRRGQEFLHDGKKLSFAAALLIGTAATAELVVPLRFQASPAIDGAYRLLATLPQGPLLELPVYSRRFAFVRSRYMLNSTAHWMPLIDAYSDYIPPDFDERADVIADFPTRKAFENLEPDGVRYAVFHIDRYQSDAREELMDRLRDFAPYLRRLYGDDRTLLYEIVRYPQ
jgi:hypothetical protein